MKPEPDVYSPRRYANKEIRLKVKQALLDINGSLNLGRQPKFKNTLRVQYNSVYMYVSYKNKKIPIYLNQDVDNIMIDFDKAWSELSTLTWGNEKEEVNLWE